MAKYKVVGYFDMNVVEDKPKVKKEYKFKKGDKVRIPLTKKGLNSGENFEAFKKELNSEWKYLLITSEYYDDFNIGVCAPNGENIVYNSFHKSDLKPYNK